MLTAGECYFSSEENIMDFLYADIWGTNYVDAGVQLMTERIREDLEKVFPDRKMYLSDEFDRAILVCLSANRRSFLKF